MPATDHRRRGDEWAMSRYLFEGQGWFAAMVWVPFFLVSIGISVIIDRFGVVEASNWEGASQLVRWYVLAIAIYVITTHFPAHIANGGTRRQFAQQYAVFTVAYALLVAVLVAVGYLLESAVYGWAGWPQVIERQAFFDSATQVGQIVLSYWLILIVWLAAVGGVTVAFYRRRIVGPLAMIPGILLIAFTESMFGSSTVPFLFDLTWQWPLVAAVAGTLVSFGAAMGIFWAAVRDMAVPSKIS